MSKMKIRLSQIADKTSVVSSVLADLTLPKGDVEAKENEIFLYGFICDSGEYAWITDDGEYGDGVCISGLVFKKRLDGMTGDVVVRINSGGGLILEAAIMAQAVQEYRAKGNAVTIMIDGMCGSAATLVAAMGNERIISKFGSFFIHRGSVLFYGNCLSMQDAMEYLASLDAITISEYATITGKSEDDIIKLMDGDGTTMTSERALAEGFVDSVYEPKSEDREDDAKMEGDVQDKPKGFKDIDRLKVKAQKSSIVFI